MKPAVLFQEMRSPSFSDSENGSANNVRGCCLGCAPEGAPPRVTGTSLGCWFLSRVKAVCESPSVELAELLTVFRLSLTQFHQFRKNKQDAINAD